MDPPRSRLYVRNLQRAVADRPRGARGTIQRPHPGASPPETYPVPTAQRTGQPEWVLPAGVSPVGRGRPVLNPRQRLERPLSLTTRLRERHGPVAGGLFEPFDGGAVHRRVTGCAGAGSGSMTTAVPYAMISVITSPISEVSKSTDSTAFAPSFLAWSWRRASAS